MPPLLTGEPISESRANVSRDFAGCLVKRMRGVTPFFQPTLKLLLIYVIRKSFIILRCTHSLTEIYETPIQKLILKKKKIAYRVLTPVACDSGFIGPSLAHK